MRIRLPNKVARLAIAGPLLLAACSPPARNPGPLAAAPPPPAGRQAPHVFTLNTPVERIAADPRGKAVLNRDIPGLIADRHWNLFDDMSLSEIAVISGGRLSRTRLDLVQADLTQIADPGGPPATPPAP